MRHKLAEQILIQFIEADVESGFALVDEAKDYRDSGHPSFSSRVLLEAAEVIADIERRLQQLGSSDVESFVPLVVELRNEISALQRENPD